MNRMAGGEGWDPMAKAFIQLFFSLKGGVPVVIIDPDFFGGRERTLEPQDGSGP